LSLNQFFGYFGGKHRLARRYPAPVHKTIVEPFAGSAGYATHHHSSNVILIERNPIVAGIWRYLLTATARDLLALPDLDEGQHVDELDVPQEARWLIGFWLGQGDAVPRPRRSPWKASTLSTFQDSWCRTVRARLAGQVEKIRHWQIIEGDYTQAPDVEATWFVDPPYEVAGKHYPCSAEAIDFPALATWCRARRGQTIVCENEGAAWLPFRPFRGVQSTSNGVSREVIWTNDAPSPVLL
jgi:hypothetical protein